MMVRGRREPCSHTAVSRAVRSCGWSLCTAGSDDSDSLNLVIREALEILSAQEGWETGLRPRSALWLTLCLEPHLPPSRSSIILCLNTQAAEKGKD